MARAEPRGAHARAHDEDRVRRHARGRRRVHGAGGTVASASWAARSSAAAARSTRRSSSSSRASARPTTCAASASTSCTTCPASARTCRTTSRSTSSTRARSRCRWRRCSRSGGGRASGCSGSRGAARARRTTSRPAGSCAATTTVAYPNVMFHFLPIAIRYDGIDARGRRRARLPGARRADVLRTRAGR